MSKCDFCMSPHPVWDYPCESFALLNAVTGQEEWVSEDGWLACEECHQLIATNHREGLLMRVYRAINPTPFNRLLLVMVYDKFYQLHQPATRIKGA